jgi:hypothetical protein
MRCCAAVPAMPAGPLPGARHRARHRLVHERRAVAHLAHGLPELPPVVAVCMMQVHTRSTRFSLPREETFDLHALLRLASHPNVSMAAVPRSPSRQFCPGPGDQGRHRHVGLDGLCPADAGQGSRHLQEERPGREHQEDPAEGPPPGHCLGRHPVRRHHGGDLGRLERQRRATTQIFQLDKSYGADGMVVKPNIAKISDLKGKTVAASAPGTAPTSAWPGC